MKYFRTFFFFAFGFSGLISKRTRNVSLTIGITLLLSSILLSITMFSGCYYYKVRSTYNPQPGLVTTLIDTGKSFVVHTAASTFLLRDLKLKGDSLYGDYYMDYQFPIKTNSFPEPNSTNRYRKYKGDIPLISEVHLYIKPDLPPGNSKIVFATSDIQRLDIYSHNPGRTTGSWIMGIIGGCLSIPILLILILLIMVLTGSSCPFIYVNTATGFEFVGEIYSGAVYAPLERNDFMVLPRIIAADGKYLLKITNELKEVQHTNLTELIVIDHPRNAEVLIDKYGNLQTAVDARMPLKATNLGGDDIRATICRKDSLSYYGVSPDKEIPLTDGAILTFDLPAGVKKAKLLIRAKNSPWLDQAYKSFHSMLGDYNDAWTRKQNKADAKILQEALLSQKMPLSVYIEKKGEWVFCDYYNMVGPMALKEDMLILDLHGLDNGSVKVKLESGSYFWEIDYVGIDYSENVPVTRSIVKIEKAITETGEDATALLKNDDNAYLVQPETSNITDLTFAAPLTGNEARTVILHSKGYYQIMQESSGFPELHKLNTYRKPGQFLEFSRELMKSKVDMLSGK
jgi:hypothetical protein